jgi:hypothetical protein
MHEPLTIKDMSEPEPEEGAGAGNAPALFFKG